MDSSPILRKKPSTILLLLKDTGQKWHLSKLAANSNSTYVYVTGLMKKFQKDGIVILNREGRSKIVSLTEKGQAISSALETLIAKLSALPLPQSEAAAQKETPAGQKQDG